MIPGMSRYRGGEQAVYKMATIHGFNHTELD
jgi:hypothetical protein